MGDITLSSAVRTNLLSLQNTADMLGKTQERLATGLKVNSAMDDPTSFFTASSLNSRAGDLNRLLDSIGNAVQTIQAADDGMKAITDLVENAQATARQALQTAGGNVQNIATVTGGTEIGADSAATISGGTAIAADTAAVATGGSLGAGTTTLASLGITNGDSITVTVGSVEKTILFNSDGSGGGGNTVAVDLTDGGPSSGPADVDNLMSALTTAFASTGVGISDGDAGGDVAVRITAGNTSDDIVITGSSAGVLSELKLDGGVAGATQTTVEPTSALNTASGSLSFTINGKVDNIRFGTNDATGEVSTRAELEAQLSALNISSNTGATFSIDATNGITVTAANAADGDITVGMTGVATETGFTNGEVGERTNATLAALVAAGSTLTISDGTNVDTIEFGAAGNTVTNKAELQSALSALSVTGSSGATGTIDASNKIVITGAEGETVTIGGAGAVDAAVTLGLALSTAPTETGVSADRAAREAEFNDLLKQIDDLAKDASYNGTNLLDGDSLSVTFNEDGSSSLSISGVTFDSAGLGINAPTSGAFQSNAAINATMAELDTAVSSLRSQSSTFGSNLSVVEVRQDFTKNIVNTLQSGADKLTLADLNQEGANALALQTRQQLSSVALSLSVQADQNVLRLF